MNTIRSTVIFNSHIEWGNVFSVSDHNDTERDGKLLNIYHLSVRELGERLFLHYYCWRYLKGGNSEDKEKVSS